MRDVLCTLQNELYSNDGIKQMWSDTISNTVSFFAMLQSLPSPLHVLFSSMHYNLHNTPAKRLVIYPRDNNGICVVFWWIKWICSSFPLHQHLIVTPLYTPRCHVYTPPCVAPTLFQRGRGAVCTHGSFGEGVRSG